MLISYCASCMNRTAQLRQTLTANLDQLRDDEELVLLDYNSADGLEAWVFAELTRYIAAGRLRFVRERDAQHFHMSKAKNLAHRAATGEILCNLDADNHLDGLSAALRERCTPDVVFHAWNQRGDGSHGRIALWRHWFYKLGGYDEAMHPMAYQDNDLLSRARALRLRYVCKAGWPKPVSNPKGDNTQHTGSPICWQQMRRENAARSELNLRAKVFVANPGGWGEAVVSVNFGPFMKLTSPAGGL